jgi:hypothetical protein
LKYDKPLVAALIGASSTIPSEILTRALVFFGIGKYSIYQLDSLLITFNRPTTLMGLILDFIMGGFTGMVFYYALQKIGLDYLVIKSASIGVLSWAFYELLFTATVEGVYFPIRPISDYYLHLLGSLIFGITMGLLYKKYLITSFE